MREMVRIMKMVEIGGGARFLRARVAPQRPSNVELITVSLSKSEAGEIGRGTFPVFLAASE
jgi:hypothetical protein